MSRVWRLLGLVGLVALAALTADGLRSQWPNRPAPPPPPPAKELLWGFEGGYEGVDVRAEGVATAAPELESAPGLVAGGQRSLALRLRIARGTFSRAVVDAAAGGVAWPFEGLSFRLHVPPELEGLQVAVRVVSGPGFEVAQSLASPLEAGWNVLQVPLVPTARPAGRALWLSKPVRHERVFRLQLELTDPRGPRSGVVHLDEVEAWPARAASPAPATEPLPATQAEIRFGAPAGRVPADLLAFALDSDVGGDTVTLEALRRAGPGRVRVALYPTLGGDLQALRPARWEHTLNRLRRTVSELRAAGFEPVVALGAFPAWAPEAERPSPEGFQKVALAALRDLPEVRLFQLEPREALPWEPAEADPSFVELLQAAHDRGATLAIAGWSSPQQALRGLPAPEALLPGADAVSVRLFVVEEGRSGVGEALAAVRRGLDGAKGRWLTLHPSWAGEASPSAPEWKAFWPGALVAAAKAGVETVFHPSLRQALAEGTLTGVRPAWQELAAGQEWLQVESSGAPVEALGTRAGALVVNPTAAPLRTRVFWEGAQAPAELTLEPWSWSAVRCP